MGLMGGILKAFLAVSRTVRLSSWLEQRGERCGGFCQAALEVHSGSRNHRGECNNRPLVFSEYVTNSSNNMYYVILNK